jgi:hypothetical protein
VRVFAVIGVLAATVLSACGGSESPETTAGAGPTTSENQTGSTTARQTIPGDPAPTELQGTWRLVSGSEELGPTRLVIADRLSSASRGGAAAQSEIVVNGDEIVFFNSSACGLMLPEGVGRYRWRVSGKMLHLEPIGKDPCGGRVTILADATYERIG